MKQIDVRGMSCPEPVLLLKKALETEKEVLLLVDSQTVLYNCEAFAKKKGLSVDTTADGDAYAMRIEAK